MEVATIKSEIGDQGVIEGRFTDQQAKDLALVLNSGALPASIKYLEERTVGPSLGADSTPAMMQRGEPMVFTQTALAERPPPLLWL